MKTLANQKCSACSGDTPKLSLNEINKSLLELEKWTLNSEAKMISKKFSFKSFKTALKFLNLIGEIAEQEKHHPDFSIGWGYCLIMIHTHAINGLSLNDFILAAKIDKITQQNQ